MLGDGIRWKGAMLAGVLLVAAQPVRAQDASCEPVALVVQAEDAAAIRDAIVARLPCGATSLAEAAITGQPLTVLTISAGPKAGISATYWKHGTPPSWVSVPPPTNPMAVVDVAAALAVVMVQPKTEPRVAEGVDANPYWLPPPARVPSQWDLLLNPYYYRAARIRG